MSSNESAVAAGRSEVRVVVAGPDGRMGKTMLAELPRQEGIRVVGGLRRDDPSAADLLADADVLVDFTVAESAEKLLLSAIEAGVRPVSGTSGLTDETLSAVDNAARARGIAAVWAANFT